MKTMRSYLPNKTRRIDVPEDVREFVRSHYASYNISVIRDTQNGYVARVEEMPGLVVAEDTQAALDASLRDVMALYIASAMRRGRPIPQPHAVVR